MVPGRDGSCRPNGYWESAQSCCVHDLCDSKMRAISCSAKRYSRMRSKKRDVERKMVTLAAMKDSSDVKLTGHAFGAMTILWLERAYLADITLQDFGRLPELKTTPTTHTSAQSGTCA